MTEKRLKVAVIGGGSSYTPELVEGLIERRASLPVTDLYLMDVAAGRDKLETVGALAMRMAARAGAQMRIHLTLDRREAIDGANFVTTQLRVGQLDARERDERIPLRYGCIGQETTGAGGFANALRTVPVLLDICRDIEQLAPDAFLLNFTNPAGIVTQAVLNHSSVRSIGLCNLPIGTRMQIAQWYETSRNAVNLEWVGINHLNWATQIRVNGVDVLAAVLDHAGGTAGMTPQNIPAVPWDSALLRSLGALPCSYLRYYYMADAMLAEQQAEAAGHGTRAQVVKRIEQELFAMYRDPTLAVKPALLAERGGAYYSLAAVQLMDAIYNNTGDIQTVNVRNDGVLRCLPDTAAIEVNCVIDAAGAHPVCVQTPLPPQIRGLLQVVTAYEELTVAAAVTGDVGLALQALIVHPLVPSAAVAERLLTDILAENSEFLPQFAG